MPFLDEAKRKSLDNWIASNSEDGNLEKLVDFLRKERLASNDAFVGLIRGMGSVLEILPSESYELPKLRLYRKIMIVHRKRQQSLRASLNYRGVKVRRIAK
jgi:hypothetical protein